MSPLDRFFAGIFGMDFASNAMSPAGRMLERMERADRRVESEGITDELLCALRRAEVRAMKEAKQ